MRPIEKTSDNRGVGDIRAITSKRERRNDSGYFLEGGI